MISFATLPVVIPIGASPGSLTFWSKVGDNPPAPQMIESSGDAVATVKTDQGNWLSAAQTYNTGFAGFAVKVDPTGLSAGTYLGSLTFSSPSSPQSTPAQVPVKLTVWDTAPQVTVSPSSLSLTAPSGASSTATVTVSSGSVPTDFSTSIGTDDGNSWLSLGSYAPYGSAYVVANAAGLPPGTYYGTVNMTAPVGSATLISVPVTFVVTPALPVQPLPGPPLVAAAAPRPHRLGGQHGALRPVGRPGHPADLLDPR